MEGMYFNNVRHFLENKNKGILEIIDPINYKESNEEFARNKKHHGILTTFSSNIELIEDGKDFILDVKNDFGLNEIVKLHREERNPNTDVWERIYISTLDLTTISEKDNKLSVKISSNELEKKLKARSSEKVEIERLDTIDGMELPELPTENLGLSGRNLLLKSSLEIQPVNASIIIQDHPTIIGDPIKKGTMALPFKVKYKANDDIHEPIQEDWIDGYEMDGLAEMMMIANVKEEINLQTNLELKFRPRQFGDSNDKFKLSYAIYKNNFDSEGNDIDGVDYVFDREVILYYSEDSDEYAEVDFDKIYQNEINLVKGESVALIFSSSRQWYGSNGYSFVEVRNISGSLMIEENSSFESTDTKTILLKNLGERITSIILGKQGLFKSSILNNTLVGAYCGHWLRGFDKLPEDEDNKYKPFTTSFNDYAKSLKSVFNISMGIQTVNGEECVIAERMEYFYNPNIAISLSEVVNVKRSVAKEFIYSGVEIGYEKGGEYEEVLGLDEPNGSISYISNMTATKNTYNYLSKYRADVYGEEIQRRKQKENSPTEDANADSDIFIKDLKRVSGQLIERTWQDDFLEEPTGIYSPETAKNLRLSPARNLKRHGAFIGIALKQYQNKYLKFGSTTANSGMSTKLIGESNGLRENSNVLNADLGRRRFEPEYIEFDHIVNYAILQQIKGTTNFNGIETPNMYCKVQFTNENNEIEFGYIISIKTSGEGKWKLLKA